MTAVEPAKDRLLSSTPTKSSKQKTVVATPRLHHNQPQEGTPLDSPEAEPAVPVAKALAQPVPQEKMSSLAPKIAVVAGDNQAGDDGRMEVDSDADSEGPMPEIVLAGAAESDSDDSDDEQ